MAKTKFFEQKAKKIRQGVLKINYFSGGSHIGSALSIVDILTLLYFKVLKIDPKKPFDEKRDRFLLSKGHAISALYVTLAEAGFFPEKILKTYCQDGGKLFGHSTRQSVAGIEVSTGSLGHGLSMGAGIALSAKKDGQKFRTFVLISDGECDEGAIWEAALFSSHHRLDNLVCLIDYNKLQAFGRTNEVLKIEPLKDKWQAFGWQVREVDGHNFEQMEKALANIPFAKNKPSLLIAHTIKGKGISYMEDKLEWHYKNPTEEDYKKALEELR